MGLGADDLGLAVEVASSGGLLLGVVVGVEDVVELGAVVAHAVGTVDSVGGVAVDTGADSGVVAADEVEDVTKVLGFETGGADAGQRSLHASAETSVGGRRQVVGRLPGGTQGRALGGLVGGLVVGGVNTLGVGLGNLRLESAEVLQLGDGAAASLDQTCEMLAISVVPLS